jgi:hypothetical protein
MAKVPAQTIDVSKTNRYAVSAESALSGFLVESSGGANVSFEMTNTPRHADWAPLAKVHVYWLPRMLIARAATTMTVTSEIPLSSIISNLARGVSGIASVVLNAVAVEYPRYR